MKKQKVKSRRCYNIRRILVFNILGLTGQHGGHESSEHDEEHGEEEEAGVVEDLAGIVADVEVKQSYQHADGDVGHESEVSQDLGTQGGNNRLLLS